MDLKVVVVVVGGWRRGGIDVAEEYEEGTAS